MRFENHRWAAAALAGLALSLLGAGAARACEDCVDEDPADAIYFGGPIVTVNDAQPSAQAVAIRAGRIVGVGNKAQLTHEFKGAKTRLVDLKGKTMLPGFIDAHGHMSSVGLQAVAANALPPPDGRNSSIPALQKTLKDWAAASPLPAKYGLIVGFGYDDSQLKEQRHPTRHELDAVSTTLPVIVIHQSGHLSAYNSRALELAGLTAASKDPQGGKIRREAGSQEPNGVLEETAHFAALYQFLAKLGAGESMALLEAGQQLYMSFGHTTAQDGRTDPGTLSLLPKAAESGKLKIDVVAYPDLAVSAEDPLLRSPWQGRKYRDHFRIGGVKLNFDGSPQGKTAWLSKPYYKVPEGEPASYAGYATFKDEEANALVTKAFKNGWQVLAHTNGDAAIAQYLNAIKVASEAVPGGVDRRPVMIHGQTLRADQMDLLQAQGVFPSLFPMHTFYWGDWHRDSVLGPERAANISPTGWMMARGIKFSSHHDAPVALPDTLRVLSATVNRTTRTGKVLGPEHRVEPIVGIKAMTLWAAYQHFEEADKGSIEVGKLADFVLLDKNPLTYPRLKIASIKVMETIKEGQTVYLRAGAAKANAVKGQSAQVQGCAESADCFRLASRALGEAGMIHLHGVAEAHSH